MTNSNKHTIVIRGGGAGMCPCVDISRVAPSTPHHINRHQDKHHPPKLADHIRGIPQGSKTSATGTYPFLLQFVGVRRIQGKTSSPKYHHFGKNGEKLARVIAIHSE